MADLIPCRTIYGEDLAHYDVDPDDCFFIDEITDCKITLYNPPLYSEYLDELEDIYLAVGENGYHTKLYKAKLHRDKYMIYMKKKQYPEFAAIIRRSEYQKECAGKIEIIETGKIKIASKVKISPILQSWRDNANVLFIFDKETNTIHDKSCEELNTLPIERLEVFEGYLMDIEYCPKCRDRFHIRLACVDDFKRFTAYKSFLTRGGLKEKDIEYFIRHRDFKMKFNPDGSLEVKVNEDTWQIRKYSDTSYTLMHNNYTPLGGDKRVINEGANAKFHVQCKAKKLKTIFNIICRYSYFDHKALKEKAV